MVNAADIKCGGGMVGAKICVNVSSSDKRDNTSIAKHPRWFYYTENGRERCQQGNESILWSLHHFSLPEKCQRKVEWRAIIDDPGWIPSMACTWGGLRVRWVG